MATLQWDQTGQRFYETGVDRGVLYIPDNAGAYTTGHAWSGLTAVTESPTGAESNPQYADNIKYLNLISAEEFSGTIEAFYSPPEFDQCDGSASPTPGVSIGQQARKTFGLSYRTKIGNDLDGQDHGYKIHLVYGALAAPSERAYATVNDSPEAMALSWEFSTTAVGVGEVGGVEYRPTATMTIDSTLVDPEALSTLEEFLYGTAGTDPSLPMPADVYAIFMGTVNTVTPTVPTYNDTTKVVTIPSTTGVKYYIDGKLVSGAVTLTKTSLVKARPDRGYKFAPGVDDDWSFSV